MGGYSINPSAVDFVCENTEYSDPLRLAGLIEIVISNQMKIWNQKKEEGEDSAK